MSECLHYARGNCAKQQQFVEEFRIVLWAAVRTQRLEETPCQHDGRIWVGGSAYLGRAEDQALSQTDCSMYAPGFSNP